MIARALNASVPCGWVLGYAVYGADRRLRVMLEERGRLVPDGCGELGRIGERHRVQRRDVDRKLGERHKTGAEVVADPLVQLAGGRVDEEAFLGARHLT